MQGINTLNNAFTPLSSNPFEKTDLVIYEPCELLAPYICCYWGMDAPKSYTIIDDDIIVPHGCIELIVEVNYTQSTISFYLAGIHDSPFNAKREINNDVVSRLSIRFFFWAYHLFISTDDYGICSGVLGDNCYDGDWLRQLRNIMALPLMESRIKRLEQFLLSKLSEHRINANFYNSVYHIISSNGAVTMKDICSYSTISQRHLERLFHHHVGASPKKIADIVRYQYLWKDILFSENLDIADIVAKYGFADQSHLLNYFRRFHGVYPMEAKQNAFNVDYFQYKVVNP